ncbi:MAG TPA: rhodanese-like domain-containing protein, partial [Ktedonobacterales bacterium]|nr:rhodanese-like domain-containing protein [Ktedonobacterales bacterium]
EEQDLLASLSDAERAASGIADHWSAKDVVAHIAVWKERHTGKIASALRGAPTPRWNDMEAVERLNAETYPHYQRQTWQQVAACAEAAYAGLVAQVEHLSEAELTDPRRFPTLDGPVWPETLGNGVWHAFTHLIWLARQRDDALRLARLEQAQITTQETLMRGLDQAGAANDDRANVRYDLACRYALAGQSATALSTLRAALTLRPALALHAKHDTDFASLRADPVFQALIAGVREAELIAPHEVHAAQGTASAPLLIDVREPDEYARAHVQGARNIPLDQLAERLAELPRDRLLVTYCMMAHRGSSRGERAALLLAEHGLQARALDGGLPGWQAAGLPAETTTGVDG